MFRGSTVRYKMGRVNTPGDKGQDGPGHKRTREFASCHAPPLPSLCPALLTKYLFTISQTYCSSSQQRDKKLYEFYPIHVLQKS